MMTALRSARRCTLAALLAGALTQPAAALESDREQPVYLEADSAELNDQAAVSVYRGNVKVTQGSTRIEGDEVTIQHHPDRKPKLVIAVGKPATYRQEVEGEEQDFHAEALRMEYDVDSDLITLIGEAVLIQGEDTFRSDRIVYDRAAALVKGGASAAGSERVRIRINPTPR